MNRRSFLQVSAASMAAVGTGISSADAATKNGSVMTVLGRVDANQLGTMLPHEHVMVDFIGARGVSRDRYDADEVFQVMQPFLQRVRAAGCRTIAECTPAFLGRDVALLRRLSESVGINLITNTGLYGARQGKFLPDDVERKNAGELADGWTKEAVEGIDGTDVKPGFIKIGVDDGELSAVNQKLVEAAAICHRRTGLTIAAHTGDGRAALQQIDILKQLGVDPSAWIWVHAQNERSLEIQRQVATSGAWVELDGVRRNDKSIQRDVEMVVALRSAGLLDRVLVSHDAGWYSVGEVAGGSIRGFMAVFDSLLPALKKVGFSDQEITQLTVINPARAFSIDVRTT